MASSVPALASDEEQALEWLEKMSNALREESYQGVFNFIRGRQFNTMQITHVHEDGEERERILQLNGERRDIVRIDDKVICHHDGSKDVELKHNVPMGPFTSSFHDNIAEFRNLYRFKMYGEGRIADRTTIQLAIQPKFDDRYGYMLWLDKETGLLLQSHLVERSRVKEVFQFSTIEIGEPIPDEALLAEINEDTVNHPLTPDIEEPPTSEPTIRVAWLPDGFRAIRVSARRLHFTDGLANFTVFLERKGRLPEMATQVGGTAVITRSLKNNGQQITVVGEVPISTARRVAESVEPVLY